MKILKEIFRRAVQPKTAEPPATPAQSTGSSPEYLVDLIICQDAEFLLRHLTVVERLLREEGRSIRIAGVYDEKALFKLLQVRHARGSPAPTDLIMDVTGVGVDAARRVIQWLESHYPQAPLPSINFLSMDLGLGITAAAGLRKKDERFLASVIDSDEIDWMFAHLRDKKESLSRLPLTTTLRRLLNAKLGCDVPLDQMQDVYYTDKLKKLEMKGFTSTTNDDVIAAWLRGELSAQETLTRMRNYATGLATSLRDGVYGPGYQSAADTPADAEFYGAAGYPRKGQVVFSVQEVEDVSATKQEKPVLVMRSYDPAVAPLLAEGKLSGLVVTSSFMASHLKLLCETCLVSGLFGLMPAGEKTMSRAFNEEAQPDMPAYFEGDAVVIAGQTIRRGQEVLLALRGNGMVFHPPTFVETASASTAAKENGRLDADLANLRKLQRCFVTYFKEKDQLLHGVKANIDSSNEDQLVSTAGIGLVRTEQIVAMNERLLDDLKRALLDNSDDAFLNLYWDSRAHYQKILDNLNAGPVKIRLFDFVHREVLNKAEQKIFLSLYPKLDIHGGEALATWPRLYRDQVEAIFRCLENVSPLTGIPLEIMMPAVRTEKDVLDIKEVITQEAERLTIGRHQYRFGVMIETLESCQNIEKIAPLCDFISFGTNDLTQQYTGIARGNLKAQANFAGKHGYDPFKILAPEILEMVRDVTARGRAANPALKVDICGAQAADPDTALRLFEAGVNNVSVAPTLGNLYGLPILLNYRAYDALHSEAPALVNTGNDPA